MHPVSFLTALVTAVAAAVLVVTLRLALPWQQAAALFYAALAVAELAYLGFLFLPDRDGRQPFDERSATTGAVE